MNVQFHCIWKKEAPDERNQTVALWKKYRVFPDEKIVETRAGEIAYLAKSETGEVIGVSTVRLEKVKLLNDNYFYEFRCFVSPDSRAPALDTKLVVKTKEFFEQNPDQSDFPVIGLIMVVENELMKAQWTKAIWAGADIVFVGYSSQGHHIRVSYFKGARI
jgi:hypothetical protein